MQLAAFRRINKERVLRYRLYFYKPNKNYRTQKVKIKKWTFEKLSCLGIKTIKNANHCTETRRPNARQIKNIRCPLGNLSLQITNKKTSDWRGQCKARYPPKKIRPPTTATRINNKLLKKLKWIGLTPGVTDETINSSK